MAQAKCPICRNTDVCDHEIHLQHLQQDEFRLKTTCDVLDHDDEILTAFCKHSNCQKIICNNCSMIEHKNHETSNIGDVVKGKLLGDMHDLREALTDLQGIFQEAADVRDSAEADFEQHISDLKQDLTKRKNSLVRQIEESYNAALSELEQAAGKIRNRQNPRQRAEMLSELNFIHTGVQLADGVLENAEHKIDNLRGEERHRYTAEVARVWQGLGSVMRGFKGQDKKVSTDPNAGLPQEVVEKRLVLPAPCVVSPDLSILHKVGVENTVLQLAFYLQLEMEALMLYDVVPLTQTEVLVCSKPQAFSLEVTRYSDTYAQRTSRTLGQGGECYMAAVPGHALVVTIDNTGCNGIHENRVLFWAEGQGVNLDGNLKPLLMTADLAPRGVALTRDNHVVLCLVNDQDRPSQPRCCIMVITLQGAKLHHQDFPSHGGMLTYPEYVTVNINNDICVTDKKECAVVILNQQLKIMYRFVTSFCPRGICHDSFGRLIVADPDNNKVRRLVYGAGEDPQWQVLLRNKQGGLDDLYSPKLLALGPGIHGEKSRLWVVCKDIILAFDYME